MSYTVTWSMKYDDEPNPVSAAKAAWATLDDAIRMGEGATVLVVSDSFSGSEIMALDMSAEEPLAVRVNFLDKNEWIRRD